MTDTQITLEDMKRMEIGQVAALPSSQLCQLLLDAAENLKQAKRVRQWVEAAIAMKYTEQIRAKRQRLEKDTGIIHIEDNGYKLTNDIPKKPEWNQEKLAEIIKNIEAQGDDPSEYVDVTYKVPESKFKAWPSSMQKIFEPARTLKTGNPTYILTPEDQGGA